MVMLEETHIFVLKKTLQLFKKKELKEYGKQLIEGVIKPDKYLRVVHHFYNPENNKGLRFLGNAKKRGIASYNKAIKLYKKGNKAKAFFFLGSSLHYIMDLAIPSHTIPVIHPFDTDDLEIFLSNYAPKIKCNPRFTKKDNIEDYFMDMARESRKLKTKKNSLLISIKYKLTGKKDKLEEKVLEKQSEKVINLAISYSAGLIREFFKAI